MVINPNHLGTQHLGFGVVSKMGLGFRANPKTLLIVGMPCQQIFLKTVKTTTIVKFQAFLSIKRLNKNTNTQKSSLMSYKSQTFFICIFFYMMGINYSIGW
jgi:hypothetical protein